MTLRTYTFDRVAQHAPTRDPDIVPADPGAASLLASALALEATLYGMPAVLQYAQMCAQALVGEGGLNHFVHRPGLAGPDHHEFRVPNVDTLYSYAWLYLSRGAVGLHLPDFGDRYFTLNLFDAHGNATNVSLRTHGRGPHRVLLTTAAWDGQCPEGYERVGVSTPLMWALLRVQVRGPAEAPALTELRRGVEVIPLGGPASVPDWPAVGAGEVESDWTAFWRALDTVLDLCGVPVEELAHVRRFQTVGLGAGGFRPEELPAPVLEGIAEGYRRAFELVRSARAQLGVPAGPGWTRVAHKGRHGYNYTARAVMNHVGLGANVVEENTSFNTYVDATGERLDAARGTYVMRLAPPPEVAHFWSVTLYDSDSGQVIPNVLDRYSVGSGTTVRQAPDGSVEVTISVDEPAGADNWLPAPRAPFFLVLRCYGPLGDVLNGAWVPAPVELVRPAREGTGEWAGD